ncbi:MBL fold metallo-hydrolase [Streptomyces sp. NEAU-174]|uniref:MBL fold metallo-hydrolase n=1 Tax=Streptomyces sp. NEAU-174 TaxID=3458254 RepID=UPI004044DD73
MRLTKFGHACVRIDKDGHRLVVDPGGLTEPHALDGADAVLVTHEHFDHFSEEALRAGFEVRVYGTWHAPIHPDIPPVGNVGFLIDDALFHPGDALTVPDATVDTLLLPVHGPWSTTGQLIDYVREVAPRDAYTIHDGALNDVGNAMLGGFLGANGPGTGARCHGLAAGTSVDIG